jgi:hypothetical protein
LVTEGKLENPQVNEEFKTHSKTMNGSKKEITGRLKIFLDK